MSPSATAAVSPQLENSYAVFSPDARLAKGQVVLSAPPPLGDIPTIIRTIELRERPFTPIAIQLDLYAQLPPDWDSYGAVPITSAAVATARAIVNDLSLRPASFGSTSLVPFSIAPVATGGIKIEWRRSDAALEIWIGDDGTLETLLDRRYSEPRFEERTLPNISSAVGEVLTFAA